MQWPSSHFAINNALTRPDAEFRSSRRYTRGIQRRSFSGPPLS
jgi:hypothetical protein